ncbi:Adenylate and Guanylate cyclase catalytic domain protein [uncultured Desulfobacterium sp.]|uniref:Adenylate and Guanylate cyclase catalytic domain protein n=1 Tax=uncultured Desulfobacterium sp. TaxID=201089 RepID=A0A445N2F5_9BACT|nr:Adenylate and Guanylate cyclase catalytic domain protein [uncultured Desulfobacterium sp.]
MSRLDCVSNRNTKIIATYVESKIGSFQGLFDGLSYPTEEYASAEAFYLNEDEWTTFENHEQIFRRARGLIDEPDFYYNCGASSIKLQAWGRFHYFMRLFATPADVIKRLPFFNNNSNDTKEIEVVLPPVYDKRARKFKAILKVQYHEDFSPNRNYMGDPYLRGIISYIPTMWGLAPAVIEQPLNSYDPVVLLNNDPDFMPYRLDVKIEDGFMTLKDPTDDRRVVVGERILLESEIVNGKMVFLGKYSRPSRDYSPGPWDKREAILITRCVQAGSQILLTAGEIFKAPYFILIVTYDNLSFFQRLRHVFNSPKKQGDSGREMAETIDQLRRTIKAKNTAYLTLEKTNLDLISAKTMLDDYARKLEKNVEERTLELQNAKDELMKLNQNLEAKVKTQVVQLERYKELRRFLSPKLTDRILEGGYGLDTGPKRRMMTVVFTDIRGFSALTDSLEPEELFHLLDNYMSEMIRIIHQYDGTLNKIVGDGLVVFFGDPIQMEDHWERAVNMAIDMQKKIADLKDQWREYGHELGVGIGINSAFMTVGNIGSDMHRDYTVIGNQVNVAARLEALAKAGQILITQRTYSKLKDMIKTEEIGTIKVKGIHDPIRIYNVVW